MDKYMQDVQLRLLEALASSNKSNARASNSKDIINKYLVLEKPKEEALEVICQTKENKETALKDCFVVDICLVVFKLFLGYADYYLVTPKVIITLASRAKLTNIRVILNTSTEVSMIMLDTTL